MKIGLTALFRQVATVEGKMQGKFTLAGTGGAPQDNGEFRLSGGALRIDSLETQVRDFNLRLGELNDTAEHTNMDAFTAQAWKMILTPAVRDAFDLSKESDQMKERYGKDSIGQSCLLARRLVEAGSRFVTAAGYHSVSWDTHSDNDKGHRDRLTPPLDRTLTALRNLRHSA